MFKLASLTLFALVSSLPLAQAAAPSKAIFAGNYNGYCKIETATGASIYYSPLRFKISKTGIITGTANNYDTKILGNVTGKINKVTVQYKKSFVGKASGKFSDGTKWTAEVNALKGITGKYITGNASQGAYSGSISLTNR